MSKTIEKTIKYPRFTLKWRASGKGFQKETSSPSYFITQIEKLIDLKQLTSCSFFIQYSPELLVLRNGKTKRHKENFFNHSITYRNVNQAIKDARIFASQTELDSCNPLK